MTPILHVDHFSAHDALTRLGLDEQTLLDAAKYGYLARSNCTANHPPLYPSFVAWGETVKALRDLLATKGWVRDDERNYSRTVHSEGHIAIAVATGDEATGVASGTPSTKSPKGPRTIDAVEVNRLQFSLPFAEWEHIELHNDQEESQPTTWLLLIHHTATEIRCELSLPLDMGTDKRVNVWRERILLRSIPLNLESFEINPPAQPDIDIEIRRKS